MFLLGAIVNAISVLIGASLGLLLPKIPESMKSTIMQGLCLAVILIGLSMALSDTGDILIIILSMVIGGVIGELLGIERWLDQVAQYAESKLSLLGGRGSVAEAFMTSSLVFCVGSLAIVGALQSGLQLEHKTLFAKSLLDGFSSVIFASTLGAGVYLSAIAVFLYEGAISTLAHWGGLIVKDQAVIACMTATGGLLIVGIGLNVMGLTKIKVANLLPAMFLAALFKAMSPMVTTFIHALTHV